MIQIVNRRVNQEDIYIGRGSALGNPYVIGKDGTRDEVIAKYKDYLVQQVNAGNDRIIKALKEIKDRSKHSMVKLGCYCKPKSCHGDIIKEYLEIFDVPDTSDKKVLAFTGHRPNKLGGYDYGSEENMEIYATMEQRVLTIKPSLIITGMALGVDTMAGYIAALNGIPFVAAVPFKGQECKWPATSQAIYYDLLSKAEEVVTVSEGGYSANKMQIRNQWMVDNCDVLLAVWNGDKSGGTYNCIQYAESQGTEIVHIKP